MRFIRLLAPILAVLILLAMTQAPALIGSAQRVQNAPTTQSAQNSPLPQDLQSMATVQNAQNTAPTQDIQVASAALSTLNPSPTNLLQTTRPPQKRNVPDQTTTAADDSTAQNTTSEPAQTCAPLLTAAFAVDGTEKSSDSQTISSQTPGENAVLVKNGGSLTLTNATIQKTGDAENTDQCDVYGLNSAVAASGGSISISDSAVTSAAQGGNALIATGEDSAIDLGNVTLSTTGDSARGLDATLGGTVTASDVTISTTGAHSASLATGQGGGSVTVDKGTLTTSGDDSPLLYSTGSITGSNLTGTAAGSQMMVIEGKNSISLTDSDLTGAGDIGVMLFRGDSGDATGGAASLSAINCKLTATSEGPFFYVTNTQAEATLAGSTLTFSSGILAQISGNNVSGWGAPGKNGGQFTLCSVGQVLSGDVVVDAISSFTLSLNDGSIYTGAVDVKNEGQSVNVTLDNNSSWTLTADAHVDALTDAKADLSNIESEGFTLYYDAQNPSNVWLNGKTIPLSGGGRLAPEASVS